MATLTTSPILSLHTRIAREADEAARDARAAEVAGLWAYRWVDCDEWEPVEGVYSTEGQARAAVRAATSAADDEFIVDELDA